MIVMKPSMVKIRYPGYYLDTETCILYSLKSGSLKEMKMNRGYHGYAYGRIVSAEPGYRISHQGRKLTVSVAYLKTLCPTDAIEIMPLHDRNGRVIVPVSVVGFNTKPKEDLFDLI